MFHPKGRKVTVQKENGKKSMSRFNRLFFMQKDKKALLPQNIKINPRTFHKANGYCSVIVLEFEDL